VVRHRDANLGDQLSTPTRYVPWLSPSEQLDPHEGNFSQFQQPEQTPDLVIVGGGGQIANRVPAYDRNLHAVAASGSLAIAWGVGHNRHDDTTLRYPAYLRRFALVGLRDWTSPYPWAPCASCLHPALDHPQPPVRDAVLYEHWQIPAGIANLPTMKNSEPSVDRVVQFLSSGEVVVTNTYHGCYWATLLGRKVVLINPFSTKFLAFRHPPVVADPSTWPRAATAARHYPAALEQCRTATWQFAAMVRQTCLQAGLKEAETWQLPAPEATAPSPAEWPA
jgi:hypothetical protein